MLWYNEHIDEVLARKTMREHREEAHKWGMTLGEYLDVTILGVIMFDYDRGIITAEECAALRKDWGV